MIVTGMAMTARMSRNGTTVRYSTGSGLPGAMFISPRMVRMWVTALETSPVPAFAGLYATTKFAVRGMSDSLRLALGPYKIGASVLCPFFVPTGIHDSARHRPADVAAERAVIAETRRRQAVEVLTRGFLAAAAGDGAEARRLAAKAQRLAVAIPVLVECGDGASHGERAESRTNSRNGFRDRLRETRAGTIGLRIPRLRTGSYFPDWLIEPRRRAERALVAVIQEAWIGGVSTRRVDDLVQAMGLVTDGLQRLFAQPGAWMPQLRNWGLSAFDRSGPIKHWMTRHAMGTSNTGKTKA